MNSNSIQAIDRVSTKSLAELPKAGRYNERDYKLIRLILTGRSLETSSKIGNIFKSLTRNSCQCNVIDVSYQYVEQRLTRTRPCKLELPASSKLVPVANLIAIVRKVAAGLWMIAFTKKCSQ